MLRMAMAFTAVFAFATAVQAEPVKLSDSQLDGVTAAGAPANFGGNGQAWTETGLFGGAHYANNNQPGLRMDWVHHRFAVPGEGGAHASPDAAVQAHGSGTLVDPLGTL